MATLRPNDRLLHRKHHKRTSTTASGLVETDDDNTQGAVYIHTINGTYPNLDFNHVELNPMLTRPNMQAPLFAHQAT